MVQLLGVGSRSDTDDHDGDTLSSHLVGDVSWILCVLGRCLGTVRQQNDHLVGVGSGSVDLGEQLVLGDSESFIDTRDGAHKWDLIDGIVESLACFEIAEGDAELGIVGECDDTGSMSSLVLISESEVLRDPLQEVFFPLVVVSQTSRRVQDESEIGLASLSILADCQSNVGGQHHECYGSSHSAYTTLCCTPRLGNER